MSLEQIEALYTAFVAALDAADYDTAINKAIALRARLSATPNLRRTGGQAVEWPSVAELTATIADLRKQQSASRAAASGIQYTKITYARPDALDC